MYKYSAFSCLIFGVDGTYWNRWSEEEQFPINTPEYVFEGSPGIHDSEDLHFAKSVPNCIKQKKSFLLSSQLQFGL